MNNTGYFWSFSKSLEKFENLSLIFRTYPLELPTQYGETVTADVPADNCGKDLRRSHRFVDRTRQDFENLANHTAAEMRLYVQRMIWL